MPSEIDLQTLSQEVKYLDETEAHRWKVTQTAGRLIVRVVLTPAASADVYCLRLDFGDDLAAGPPSVTFCNPHTYSEGSSCDWPRNLTQYFKHPPGNGVGWICNEWTREGRQHHAEWTRPWKVSRAVWRVTTAIQDILDKPGNYLGRNA